MATTTITFSERVENHVGMETKGELAPEGLTLAELEAARAQFTAMGYQCTLIDLVEEGKVAHLQPAPEPAYVLVVHGGVAALLDEDASVDMLKGEHDALVPDRRFYNQRTGTVCNKHARWNLCYTDESQEPAYEEGRGRVVAFSQIPITAGARAKLPQFFGPKAEGLFAEGNFYYNATCGIGPHGDAERRIVIAFRLGAAMYLDYHWYQRHRPVGNTIPIRLHHGDLYAMSAKAVGTDWRKSVIPTLRHAAGHHKYRTFK